MIKDLFPQRFIERVNGYEQSFAKYIVDNYPAHSLDDTARIVNVAWDEYSNLIENSISLSASRFHDIKVQIEVTYDMRACVGEDQEMLALCDTIGDFLANLLEKELNPSNFSRNWADADFANILRDYCLSQEPDDSQSKKLDSRYWEDRWCLHVKRTIIPHITTPFILMLLRYTYYHKVVRKMFENVEYRRSIRTLSPFDFSHITKVDWGKYSPRDVCEHYAQEWFGGGLFNFNYRIVEEITKQGELPHDWHIILVETEGLRLRKDYTYLQKHFNRRFVTSLMEWHQHYFDYLVENFHNCEEYKDYPIEKLVPQLKISKPKQKIIDETRALTPLGLSCRKSIAAKIRECRTAAGFGALLYKLQYDLKFFTKGVLSNNEYYSCMQQIGKVHFDSSGDFSNCNKGYNLAMKRASKK